MLEAERNKRILQDYKSGKTLQDISDIFKVTRSRVQQIVTREIEHEILQRLGINYRLPAEDRQMLRLAAKEEIQQITEERDLKVLAAEKQKLVNRIKDNKKLQDPSSFPTLTSYAEALGVDIPTLKKHLPNTVNQIHEAKEQRWSVEHDSCQICNTISIPHKIKGFCKKCYTKSKYFKDIQKKSFLKHIDKRKATMQKYMISYNERPEVKERLKRSHDELNFGGNREKAMERDGYKCTKCGISRNDSQSKWERDLYVLHIEGKDNDLKNLITLCRDCHSERILELARQTGNETLFQKYKRLYNKADSTID